jgi:hypothetical protein
VSKQLRLRVVARPVPNRVALSILQQLARYEGLGATPKVIARDAKLPLRTVKRHLADLVRDEVIERPFHGHYVYRPGTPDITADPNGRQGVHGLVLSGTMDLLRRSGGPMPLLFPAPEPSFRYSELTSVWKAHLVRFRYYPSTDRFLVYVPATRDPIGWEDLGHFEGWLSGVLSNENVGEVLSVVQIGVHVDHETWELKGIRGIQLSEWRNALVQLYQKREALRHEVHAHYKQGFLPLDRAVHILSEGSPTRAFERALQIQLRVAQTELALKAKEVELEQLRQGLGPSGKAPSSDKKLTPNEALDAGYG